MVDRNLIANNLMNLLKKKIKINFNYSYYDKAKQKSNFNFIVDKICDNSTLKLLSFSSKELYILRIILGFYNNGIINEQQIGYILKNHEKEIIKIVNEIVNFIVKSNVLDNKSRISSLMIYKIYDNFPIADLELPFFLKKILLDFNINTLYDLLSYSRFDFKKLGISETNIKEIYEFIRSRGLKCLDELTLQEKCALLKSCNMNTILQSSISLFSDIVNIDDIMKLSNANEKISISSIINLPLSNEEMENLEAIGFPIKFFKCKHFLISLIQNYINKKNICFYFNYNSIELDNLAKLIIKSDIESLFIITHEELLKLRKYINDFSNKNSNSLVELDDMESIVLKLIGIVKKGVDNFPRDNKNRMSSLSLFNNYHDFYLYGFSLSIELIIELQENGINTLYDLLSYSLNDLKNIIDSSENFNKIVNLIHSLNLKFIDELSDKEKKIIIELNKDSTEVILNSSLSFLPYKLFNEHIPKNKYYKNFLNFYESRPNKFSAKFISLIEKFNIPISYCKK